MHKSRTLGEGAANHVHGILHDEQMFQRPKDLRSANQKYLNAQGVVESHFRLGEAGTTCTEASRPL